jgi:hypothetical protein
VGEPTRFQKKVQIISHVLPMRAQELAGKRCPVMMHFPMKRDNAFAKWRLLDAKNRHTQRLTGPILNLASQKDFII